MAGWTYESPDANLLVDEPSEFDVSQGRQCEVSVRPMGSESFEVISTDQVPEDPTERATVTRVVADEEGVHTLVEAGGKKLYRVAVASRYVPCPVTGLTFNVAADAEAGGGLTLRAGDEYRLLECNGNAVQIEVPGDEDNPYFVSAELLCSISDFPGEHSRLADRGVSGERSPGRG